MPPPIHPGFEGFEPRGTASRSRNAAGRTKNTEGGKRAAEEAQAKSEGKNNSNKNNNNNNNKGSGKKPDGPKPWHEELLEKLSDPQNRPLLLSVGILLGAAAMMTANNDIREITWHDFRLNYLEMGKVEKLVVTDKSKVKVYLKSNSGVTEGTQRAAQLYFTIGSVESFERSLDQVRGGGENAAGTPWWRRGMGGL